MLSRYWRYQIFGWGLVAVLDTGMKLLNGPQMQVKHIALAWSAYLFCFLASHLLRRAYRSLLAAHKTSLPRIGRLVGLALVGSLVAALLALIAAMLLLWVLGELSQVAVPLTVMIAGNFLFFFFLLLLWSALYLLITRQRQLQRLASRNEELDEHLAKSQLHQLINQLNPHFIFNCINNIRALILEDQTKAREMLSHMAEMLRYTLQSNQSAVSTLAEEMEIASSFIALASIQFEDRLQFELHLEPDVDPQLTLPRMLLQLLLENAVKHGIAKLPQGGRVELSISKEDERLLILVRNPGLFQQDVASKEGVGLENIRERLSLLYGTAGDFEIRQQGERVEARVTLPIQRFSMSSERDESHAHSHC